jgi:hypothetical protein
MTGCPEALSVTTPVIRPVCAIIARGAARTETSRRRRIAHFIVELSMSRRLW